MNKEVREKKNIIMIHCSIVWVYCFIQSRQDFCNICNCCSPKCIDLWGVSLNVARIFY